VHSKFYPHALKQKLPLPVPWAKHSQPCRGAKKVLLAYTVWRVRLSLLGGIVAKRHAVLWEQTLTKESTLGLLELRKCRFMLSEVALELN